MSSPRVRSRHTPAARKNLDEFDLTAFNDRPTVRALLLPESCSAEHSVRLAENEAKTAHVASYEPLPSPSNSSSEDESSIPRAASGPKTSGNNARAREARSGSQRIIILEQSRFDEKFRFVSSSDIGGLATGNDVVLKHPNSENQDICYINLVHLEVYPDPDRDGLVLCNRSTSEFIAHSLLIPQTNKIKPGHKATLQGGTWRLTLGKGLTFQIKVLPHTPSELYHGCLRLSPRGSASCKKPSEGSAGAQGLNQTTQSDANQPFVPCVGAAEEDLPRYLYRLHNDSKESRHHEVLGIYCPGWRQYSSADSAITKDQVIRHLTRDDKSSPPFISATEHPGRIINFSKSADLKGSNTRVFVISFGKLRRLGAWCYRSTDLVKDLDITTWAPNSPHDVQFAISSH